MKRRFVLALILALLLITVSSAAVARPSRPVLVTAYRQVGAGDRVQIGYVDEDGGLWFLEGDDRDLHWPYGEAEQIAWIESAKGFTSLGTLSFDDLFVLDSLVQCVESQGADRTSAASDAGTEASYAVQYRDDSPEIVLLGMSGDERFENTDATAQALYRFLRTSFPGVRSYFGKSTVMAPAGFQPVPLLDFCGYAGLDLQGLHTARTDIDCEASTEPVPLTGEEADALCARIEQTRVIGKHSCIVTTGGSTVYTFTDASGHIVAAFEYYGDLLVARDGMYAVAQGA